jgi:gas vesicle protein
MKALTTLTVALSATAIGITLGLLFAPNKGSKTRNKISKKSHQYADYAGESFDDLLDTVSHSVENIETKTAQLAQQVKADAKKKIADLN